MSEVKSSLAEVALVQAIFVLEDFLEESEKREKSDTEVLTELGARSKLGLIPRASSLTQECGKQGEHHIQHSDEELKGTVTGPRAHLSYPQSGGPLHPQTTGLTLGMVRATSTLTSGRIQVPRR